MDIVIQILIPLSAYGFVAMKMTWQRRRRMRKALEDTVSSSIPSTGDSNTPNGLSSPFDQWKFDNGYGSYPITSTKPTHAELRERQYYRKAARGETGVQIISLVLSITLIANTLLFLIGYVVSGILAIAIFSGIFLAVATPITLFVNMAWIFSARITRAEEESLKEGPAKLIKIERYLAWAVWIFFTGFAFVVVIRSTLS